MDWKIRRFPRALIIASVLLAGGTLAQPAEAQVGHPQHCRKDLTTAWAAGGERFVCGAIEVETDVTISFSCIPGPGCPSPIGTPHFWVRARRLDAPNINFARSTGIYSNGATTCALSPPTTAWTAWKKCSQSAPPPILRIESLYVLVF
jgi:lambda repressor-like predicted transcriptional regulator